MQWMLSLKNAAAPQLVATTVSQQQVFPFVQMKYLNFLMKKCLTKAVHLQINKEILKENQVMMRMTKIHGMFTVTPSNLNKVKGAA